uniref:Uncharacterized protein n=1 Tax=Leishmania guyanensis TaxID=5670 RepID=A0A1E1IWU6_LEIGU|nr:Hypothetical protein BN36_2332880 [Leishmania guyanensis]
MLAIVHACSMLPLSQVNGTTNRGCAGGEEKGYSQRSSLSCTWRILGVDWEGRGRKEGGAVEKKNSVCFL